MSKWLEHFEFVWEIPLALLSFLFYRITRGLIHLIVQIHSLRHPELARQWRVLDRQALEGPLNLPALMTSAPRWNTHAIIALAGPFEVKQAVRLQAQVASQSAESWSVVVHKSPGHQIIASTGSLDASKRELWRTIQLAPGSYRLALRYYHWQESPVLPAIEVDGREAVSATPITANVNDFYCDLAKRSNLFYQCLHYYIGPLLRYRRWLPQAFVEGEYLPAGNPQTEFYYGFLRAGNALAFDLNPQSLQTNSVYFTAYNRASFPVLWYPLREAQHVTLPMPCDGSYLVRVHASASSAAPLGRESVRIRVQSPPPAASEQREPQLARDSVQ